MSSRAAAARSGLRGVAPALSGWTTRQWLRRGMAAALAVLVLLGALAIWILGRMTTVTDAIVNVRSPAYVQAVLLQTALLNQETGIRGYGLSGQPEFLQPYRDGLAEERSAAAQLRSLLAGDAGGIADLDEVLARAATWQQRIAAPIAAVPAGAPIALATERADEGIVDFDAIRAASSAEQAHLLTARQAARSSLREAVDLNRWVFSAIALVMALLAALVFEGLRRGITAPLGRLSGDARLVAAGDFGHPIGATGPADLRALAGDVEQMRRRLAAELEAAGLARRSLDEQAAELRRSNAELEQFAYVASHDLQEPLRKVASFCQLLQRRYAGQLDERADQYIGFAVDGATRMQTMIDDLLTLSRVGRAHRRLGPVDLEQTLAAVTDVLALALDEAGARLTHDPLPEVYGDGAQLSMLLQNLIGNAIKFRDPGRPPRIHVSAVRTQRLWQFAVSDNGIGIGAEYADRVFVIFQRLHTKEAYPGTGIGLALCKKIVEFHGGSIALDPEHSPGTRITFTLPAADPEPRP
jgi:signal transduction histidine kinase